jgi:hypothetical protein
LPRNSEAAPTGILAQVTSELLGRSPAAQFVDLLVFRYRTAMDGVLKPLQFGLEMPDACLERLESALRTEVGRPRVWSQAPP